jgi:hypothetical protein
VPRQLIFCRVAPNGRIQTATYQGQPHLVVPVVALVAGVVNGHLAPADEIATSLRQWNGVPLVVNHPQDAQGLDISANASPVVAEQVIGRLWNCTFTQNRLRGELWINLTVAEALGGEIWDAVQRLQHGEALEVSTGFFAQTEEQAGTYRGRAYEGVYRDIRPDHLALLPNASGACSWEDGCGAPRLHQQQACPGPRSGDTPGVFLRVAQAIQELVTLGRRSAERVDPLEPWPDPVTHVRSSARRPSYDGTETSSWGDVSKTFAAYRDGYYRHSGTQRPSEPPARVQDAPQAMRSWMASKTLLGEASATEERDLLFFPVVNPSTDRLNAGALRAVLGGRGAAADIPASALESARTMARSLLRSEFAVETHQQELQTQRTDVDIRTALYDLLAQEMGVTVTPIMIQFLDPEEQAFVYRNGERVLIRRYTVGEDGALALAPEVQSVQLDTRLIPVGETMAPGDLPQPTMMGFQAQEGGHVDKTQAITTILTNLHLEGAEQRAALEALDGAALTAFATVTGAMPQPQAPAAPPPVTTVPEALARLGVAPSSPVYATLDAAVKTYEAQRTALIAALVEAKCPFPHEQLAGADLETLERYRAMMQLPSPSTPPVASYLGQGAPSPVQVQHDLEPWMPPAFFTEQTATT